MKGLGKNWWRGVQLVAAAATWPSPLGPAGSPQGRGWLGGQQGHSVEAAARGWHWLPLSPAAGEKWKCVGGVVCTLPEGK